MGHAKDLLIQVMHESDYSLFKTGFNIMDGGSLKKINPTNFSYDKLFHRLYSKFIAKCAIYGLQPEDMIQDVTLACLQQKRSFSSLNDAYKFYCTSIRNSIKNELRKKMTFPEDDIREYYSQPIVIEEEIVNAIDKEAFGDLFEVLIRRKK